MSNVRLEGIRKTFDIPEGKEVAVDRMDLEIDDGEFFTFVGPSGCGKTTTLRMIAGLETPTEGDIYFDEEKVTNLPPQERDIAMVFQNVALFPHMTSRENISFPLRVRNELEGVDEKLERVAELLEIGDVIDKKPGQLSGGQQQRVALGRAIIREPNVILLDEPMSDLDAQLKSELRVEVQRIHQEVDTTMIYVTHDQEEAMTMSTQIGLMNDGNLVQVDTPEHIFQSPSSEFVARFIGQPSMNIIDVKLSPNGDLITDNGDLVANVSRIEDEIGDHVQGEYLKLGFRPRHVKLTENLDESLFSLEVDVSEPIGTDYIVHLYNQKGDEINVVTDDIPSTEIGDEIGVKELSTMYLFNPETGEKILQIDSEGGVVETLPQPE